MRAITERSQMSESFSSLNTSSPKKPIENDYDQDDEISPIRKVGKNKINYQLNLKPKMPKT